MRAIGESAFDILYLALVLWAGVRLLKDSKGRREFLLMGAAALVLGIGDAFHLAPRVMALWTEGEAGWSVALSFGKLVTSITMTAFYVMLYHIWCVRYGRANRRSAAIVYALALVRVVLCLLFPAQQWFTPNQDGALVMAFSMVRNLPFVALGALVLAYYFAERRAFAPFRWMWLAILLSFAFYIPVALWAEAAPQLGMLMIPKTVCYLWMVRMFLRAERVSV